ncbi:MAG: HEAT repeat domain-containing protein [Phycisphaerales bacterium]|nr:HEAT repeat domain-containing protein [Phycisphaerales bacterium]
MSDVGPGADSMEEPARRGAGGRLRLIGILAVVLIPVVLFGVEMGRRLTTLNDLRADQPATRKRAAWRAAETPFSAAMTVIRARLDEGEPDANVREAFVYALGRGGDADDSNRLETIATTDPHGYVRQAAWLALARLNAGETRALATRFEASDEWDRLARDQALLMIGDTTRVESLLTLAESGSEDQRVVASRALLKGLYPLLDACGQWPIDADTVEGRPLAPETIAELRNRVNLIDLAAIEVDTAPQIERGAGVRRLVSRLDNARERVRRLLFK